MTTIPFADHFLAGAILTLLIPAGLLVAVAVWYVVAVRRMAVTDRAAAAAAVTAGPPTPPSAADASSESPRGGA